LPNGCTYSEPIQAMKAAAAIRNKVMAGNPEQVATPAA
jgi:hypothetical protein